MNVAAHPTAAIKETCPLQARLNGLETSMRERKFGEARQLAVALATDAPENWPGLNVLSQTLFQLGAFRPAFDVIKAAVKTNVADSNTLRNLAAIYFARGDDTSGKDWLRHACRVQPVLTMAAPSGSTGTILCLQSGERQRLRIDLVQPSGLYMRRFGKGHFSTNAFLDFDDKVVLNGLVYGDNLRAYRDVPGVDIIINTIGCPELQSNALNEVSLFLQNNPHIPVINHPDIVKLTSRVDNARRLSAIDDVIFPKTVHLTVDRSPVALANALEVQGFGYPVIVRGFGSQTGRTLQKHDDRHSLIARLSQEPDGAELYAIAYHDCRGPMGFFHKTRVFFIDGVLYPVASLSSDVWNIHSNDRYRIMPDILQTQEREQAFLQDPKGFFGAGVMAQLQKVRQVIGLDFFGIDFALDTQGRLVVFEANALMRHNFDHADAFPYTRPYLERVSKAFDAMVTGRMLTR